ncbi:MAG TPA: hypothetical protein PLA38_00680 [bacterium]|nr:hypothetical protein [bacterium]HRS72974.1 hypothetical protein [Patescibacteria group bacterium]HOR69324.1 hypothetical protein [bacterium]HOS99081.1 hypothetical protein [bacterium]HPD03382.1 hypothetical protein [bacterium]
MSNKIEGGLSPQEQLQKTEFRELRPEEFWGGLVSVEGLSDEEFAKKISEAANELGFTYSGYRIPKGEEGFDYHFSRYPRRAFGPVVSVEKHQEALEILAKKLGTEGREEKKTEQPRFRVLLGLQEGYSEYKKRGIVERINKGEIATLESARQAIKSEIGDLSEFGINLDEFTDIEELKTVLEKTNFGKDHTFEEVQRELGEGFDLTQAEIYSVGPWGNYTEPALVIEGDKAQVQKVYALAEKFHQARIAVEDLQIGQSHMVETKYCEDPDEE